MIYPALSIKTVETESKNEVEKVNNFNTKVKKYKRNNKI